MSSFMETLPKENISHSEYLKLSDELKALEEGAIYSEIEKPQIPVICVTGEFLRKEENGGVPISYFNLIGFKNKDGRDELGAGGFTIGKNGKYLNQSDFNEMLKKSQSVFAALKEANKVPGGTVI